MARVSFVPFVAGWCPNFGNVSHWKGFRVETEDVPQLFLNNLPLTCQQSFPWGAARGVNILSSDRVPKKHAVQLDGCFLFCEGDMFVHTGICTEMDQKGCFSEAWFFDE